MEFPIFWQSGSCFVTRRCCSASPGLMRLLCSSLFAPALFFLALLPACCIHRQQMQAPASPFVHD